MRRAPLLRIAGTVLPAALLLAGCQAGPAALSPPVSLTGGERAPRVTAIDLMPYPESVVLQPGSFPLVGEIALSIRGPDSFRVTSAVDRLAARLKQVTDAALILAEGPGVRAERPGVRAEGPGVRAEGPGVRAEGPGVRAEGPGVRAEGPLNVSDSTFTLEWNRTVELSPDVDESYTFTVGPRGIALRAGTDIGVVRGIATLSQLALEAPAARDGALSIAALTVPTVRDSHGVACSSTVCATSCRSIR